MMNRWIIDESILVGFEYRTSHSFTFNDGTKTIILGRSRERKGERERERDSLITKITMKAHRLDHMILIFFQHYYPTTLLLGDLHDMSTILTIISRFTE